jgi:hypothetical protein
MLTTLLLSLALASPSRADCPRAYVPGTPHELRLVTEASRNTWELGTESAGEWRALLCGAPLGTAFFDGSNTQALAVDGEAHAGLAASVVFFPSAKIPTGVTFSVNPESLFGADRIEIDLPGQGKAFLDGKRYERLHKKIGPLHVEIDVEPGNPAKDTAILVLDTMTRLLPHAARELSKRGHGTVLLFENQTEKFSAETVWPNGVHDPRYLYSVLFSQDGVGGPGREVLRHSFHEIGGLFRISDPEFAHGLTWMVSYDQMEKLAPSNAERARLRCEGIERVISNLSDTASQNGGDLSHPIEYYLADPFGRNGYPLYAWGSAFYWKKINAELETRKLSSMYKLIDSIHRHGMPEGTTSLDQLMAAYRRVSRKGSELFDGLATRYFRQETLGQLLSDARAEQSLAGCHAGPAGSAER